jgi:hypothetical protein
MATRDTSLGMVYGTKGYITGDGIWNNRIHHYGWCMAREDTSLGKVYSIRGYISRDGIWQ